MAKTLHTGQPGNTVPISGPASTDYIEFGYQIGFRRPVVALSSNTYTVSASESGTMFTYGGQGSGIVITLPKPEVGLWFEFAATGAIATAVTKITCAAATGAFVRPGDSGGCDSLVAEATTSDFTAAEGGLYLELVGLSTTQYLARQWSGGSSVASTAQWKASS